MDIKSNLTLLSEAASADTSIDTRVSADRNAIVEAYAAIPTCHESIVTTAADVVVTETANREYFVEMSNLAPFMMDSGIRSISAALNFVAEANGLMPGDVGLIVESHQAVHDTLEAAAKRANANNNPRILESALAKVARNVAVVRKLVEAGYDVKAKSKDSKVCPNCGKATCNCECDTSGKLGGGQVSEGVMSLNEVKTIKSVKEIENKLRDIEKKPEAIDHVVHTFIDYFKFGLVNLVGLGLPGLIFNVVQIFCGSMYRIKGSISDKRVGYNKMLKQIDASIDKYKNSSSDKDKELLEQLKKSKTYIKEQLDKLDDSSAGRSQLYQNTHAETTLLSGGGV